MTQRINGLMNPMVFEDDMMKRFPWLVLFAPILFLLAATFPVSAQNQTPTAPPPIKMVAVTLLVRDYDKATKW